MSTNPPTNEPDSDAELDNAILQIAAEAGSIERGRTISADWFPEAKAALTAWRDRCVAEAEKRATANGRRIQAEATLDKWKAIPYAGDSSEFPIFMHAQVEAWRYEVQQLTLTEPTHE